MSATPTANQLKYLKGLCQSTGLSQEDAIAIAKVKMPLSIESASNLIDFLRGVQEGRASTGAGTDSATSNTISATDLRQISSGMKPAPGQLGEDENWILFRLAKLTDLEQAIGKPVAWTGANAGEAIRVEHLIEYFGSIEAVATAFKVAVGTVRSGWGGMLPANRSHEAAWLTRGFVQPPA